MARRAKGEGSLYKAKDNSWVYQYQEDGKRKTKRFRKRADAAAFIKALSAAQDEPKEQPAVPIPPEQKTQEEAGKAPQKRPRARNKTQVLTVGAWMDRWLENYAKPTVKLSTYASYELYIRAHVKPLIGDLYMNMLSVDDLQDFFNNRGATGNLVTGEGLSPKTLTNMRNMLHLAFDQAVKNRILKFNPIEGVRIPRAVNKEMRVLSREEQEKLIEAARTSEELASFGIIFDLFTGLRIGEICGLRWRNVQLDQQCFQVRETRNRLPNYDPNAPTTTTVQTFPTTKTDNSRRTVYLMDDLFKDLVIYKGKQDAIAAQCPGYNPDGYVFCQPNGNPYEPRAFQDLFKRCVKRADIADANFHSLIHTFATRSLEEGMDIVTLSRLLGHANPSVTMDKYGHSMEDHKRTSMEKLGSLYGGGRRRKASHER